MWNSRCLNQTTPILLILMASFCGCNGDDNSTPTDDGSTPPKKEEEVVASECDFKPPVLSDEAQREVQGKIAAELKKLPVGASGEIQGKFEDIVKTQFDTLNDETKALLLFLQAINCFLEKGAVGEEIAKTLTDIVKKRWSAKKGLSGTTPELTPAELKFINESTEAEAILSLLKKIGIET